MVDGGVQGTQEPATLELYRPVQNIWKNIMPSVMTKSLVDFSQKGDIV